MYIGLLVKYPLFLPGFNETSRHILENFFNVKYHENSSSGVLVVPCGPADRRTHMMKLIAAFRSFTNVKKTYVLKTIAFINYFELQAVTACDYV
jgi:hypothetical protein